MSNRENLLKEVHILQEKERLDNKYTYHFYLRSLNGRVGGAGSNHNEFGFEVPAIPDMNIKDCCCRIKHLVLPKGTAIINANIQVDCDFLKNKNFDSQFLSGLTNQNLGLFNVKKQLAEFSTNTTIVGTTFKKIKADGSVVNGDATAIAGADNATIVLQDGGTQPDSTPPSGTDKVGGFLTNPVMSVLPVPKHLGFTAEPLNTDFIECNNLFGRKINFKIKNKNGVDLQNCGTSNSEGVYLILEVKLLPNPIESIKHNY